MIHALDRRVAISVFLPQVLGEQGLRHAALHIQPRRLDLAQAFLHVEVLNRELDRAMHDAREETVHVFKLRQRTLAQSIGHQISSQVEGMVAYAAENCGGRQVNQKRTLFFNRAGPSPSPNTRVEADRASRKIAVVR